MLHDGTAVTVLEACPRALYSAQPRSHLFVLEPNRLSPLCARGPVTHSRCPAVTQKSPKLKREKGNSRQNWSTIPGKIAASTTSGRTVCLVIHPRKSALHGAVSM